MDIARLVRIAGDIPPEFPAEPPHGPETVDPRWIAQVGDPQLIGGLQWTSDPVQCAPLFKPVVANEGVQRTIVGASRPGPERRLIQVSAYTPVSMPAALPTTGCDHMSFRRFDASGASSGTVERLPAPTIDGVQTAATASRADLWEFMEYRYFAILDGRTFVEAAARVHPDVPVQDLLSDLLVKGVSAIRG